MPSLGLTGPRIWIGRFFPKGGFARSVAVLAGGTGLGQAIAALASPLLTRLYAPEDFGTLAVFTAILGLLVVVSTLRYELAIPLPEDDTIAANLLLLALGILILMSGLAGLFFWQFEDRVVEWTEAPALRPYLWLIPIGVFAAGTYQVLNYWAIRKKQFSHIAFTKFSQGLGAVSVQLGLGVLKLAPLGLLLGQVIGQAAGSGTLGVLALRKDAKTLLTISYLGMLQAANRYRRFPAYSTPSALLMSAWLQLPALLLAAFHGTEVAGWFALGQLVLGVPIMLIGNSVGQVYLAEAVRLVREQPEALHRLFLNTAGRLFLVGAVPLGVIALGGPDLFEFVFGPTWPEAGFYVQFLAPMFMLRFAVVPISQTLVVLERQDLFFYFSIVRFLATIGALLVASWLAVAPHIVVLVYSATMALIYLSHFALIIYALRAHREKQPGRA